ncbi:acetyltransferase [Methylovulum psychrotolerans]|uniref:Acetyltransferase n=1 Tax=Methylovulum psychrotolerans TaxID=1704499 RepID=A0A1Z4BYS0_9GAMM|nr:acetyltransferase [Methylovulum psychrotolerans]
MVYISEIVGVNAFLVHALSGQTACFYDASGFYPSPINAKALFLPLSEV